MITPHTQLPNGTHTPYPILSSPPLKEHKKSNSSNSKQSIKAESAMANQDASESFTGAFANKFGNYFFSNKKEFTGAERQSKEQSFDRRQNIDNIGTDSTGSSLGLELLEEIAIHSKSKDTSNSSNDSKSISTNTHQTADETADTDFQLRLPQDSYDNHLKTSSSLVTHKITNSNTRSRAKVINNRSNMLPKNSNTSDTSSILSFRNFPKTSIDTMEPSLKLGRNSSSTIRIVPEQKLENEDNTHLPRVDSSSSNVISEKRYANLMKEPDSNEEVSKVHQSNESSSCCSQLVLMQEHVPYTGSSLSSSEEPQYQEYLDEEIARKREQSQESVDVEALETSQIRSQANTSNETFEDNPVMQESGPPSPKQRMDHVALPDSPRVLMTKGIRPSSRGNSFKENSNPKHLAWFSLGPVKTLFSISMAILAFCLSLSAKHSTNFVRLQIPITMGGHFQELNSIGLYYVKICRANEVVSVDYSNDKVTILSLKYDDSENVFSNPTESKMNQLTTGDYFALNTVTTARTGDSDVCTKIRLETATVIDGLWNFSRVIAGVTEWLGGFLAFTLICSCFWKSMNLVPIGIGLLVTYICQGLAFAFFETNLCKEHGCIHSSGTNVAIGALTCWFFSWVGVLSMVLHERRERNENDVIPSNERRASETMDPQKRRSRRLCFMRNQNYFWRIFSRQKTELNAPTCECDTDSEPSRDLEAQITGNQRSEM